MALVSTVSARLSVACRRLVVALVVVWWMLSTGGWTRAEWLSNGKTESRRKTKGGKRMPFVGPAPLSCSRLC